MNCKLPIIMEKNINLVIILILIYLLHLIAMSLKFSSICISIYSLIHLISFLEIFIKEKTILFTNSTFLSIY